MYFKEKVVQLRKDASMTQEFFAQEVGVSRQAVYKWEKGLSYPEAEKLILIAKLFDVTIDSLLEDDFDLFKVRGLSPIPTKESGSAVIVGKKKAAKKKKAATKKVKEVKEEVAVAEEKAAVEEIVVVEEKEAAVEKIENIAPALEKVEAAEKNEAAPLHTVRKVPAKKPQPKPQNGLFDGLRGIFSRRK